MRHMSQTKYKVYMHSGLYQRWIGDTYIAKEVLPRKVFVGCLTREDVRKIAEEKAREMKGYVIEDEDEIGVWSGGGEYKDHIGYSFEEECRE